MKNNKKYSAYVEWAIAVIILVICFNIVLSNRSFSPIKAHEKLEKTQHFGPSKIVNTLGVRDGEIYLCRYKDWFAAQLFGKNLFMWQPRAGEMGIQIDLSKDITYNWYAARIKDNPMTVNLYGYVNDPQISKIILEGESNKNT